MKKKYTFIFLAIISILYFGCAKDKDVEQVVEEGKEIPIADFKGRPRKGPAPLTVEYTDQSSQIPTVWLWTLGDNSTSIVKNPTRTYTKEGVYSITLTVSNKLGSDTKIRTEYITVTASNTSPEVSYAISPTGGTINTVFEFNATTSSDDYDPLDSLNIRWDFDGNGVWDTDWSTLKIFSHQYTVPGNYNTELQIKDSEGLLGHGNMNLIVNPNAHPSAYFIVNQTSGLVGHNFLFNASNSSDDDLNGTLEFRWDFDGNGTWDTGWDTIESQNHQYSNVGNYNAKLEVKDSEGLKGQHTKSITIVPNDPPTAVFTVSPYYGTTNSYYTFDANNCTDDFDPLSALQVRWDYDGNGTWDTDWENNKIQQHLFDIANTYNARLEVKDAEGAIGEYTKNIIVHDYVTSTFTDTRDGQVYKTIEIGNQTWLAENLNFDKDGSWWYNNSSVNGDIYGRLYTRAASHNACPMGWHLPSDPEWKTLEKKLGMSQSEADDTGWRGINEGACLKETGTEHWVSPNSDATNGSGFTALPGGLRTDDGEFIGIHESCTWWTNTIDVVWISYYRRWIEHDGNQIHRDGRSEESGRSVRCIKD